jgi:hypothetical protein
MKSSYTLRLESVKVYKIVYLAVQLVPVSEIEKCTRFGNDIKLGSRLKSAAEMPECRTTREKA